MPDAVIVSTARTPLCKSWRGAFNVTHGATMGGHALCHAIARARLESLEERHDFVRVEVAGGSFQLVCGSIDAIGVLIVDGLTDPIELIRAVVEE